jgi:hypothetical protein
VYKAFDNDLHREVALKVTRADASSLAPTFDPDRLVREARLLARVRHANVVTVYAAERKSDEVGVSMELIKGDTLHDVVRAQRATERERGGAHRRGRLPRARRGARRRTAPWRHQGAQRHARGWRPRGADGLRCEPRPGARAVSRRRLRGHAALCRTGGVRGPGAQPRVRHLQRRCAALLPLEPARIRSKAAPGRRLRVGTTRRPHGGTCATCGPICRPPSSTSSSVRPMSIRPGATPAPEPWRRR